jgi:uncharacterized repeat protein (TIGR01451 family)
MMVKRFSAALVALSLLGASALWSDAAHAQCVSLTTVGVASTQNFDTLSSAGTSNIAWADNSTIPGWYSTRTTYNSATGSSNAGSLYSFGVAGTNPITDRALGGVASNGTGTFYWAACFTNNTGAPLTAVDVSYNGEQWRNGGNATAHVLQAQVQVANAGVITDADTPSSGWLLVSTLDFTSPVATATAAALDGNLPANRQARSASVVAPIAVGQEFWIRWVDVNEAGNDHGLAIDDLSITPQGAGAPVPGLSINDVAVTEGNAGTVNAVFTVSLNLPAGPGGVTFDIATADNTATTANNDYNANSLAAQTIPQNSSTYQFTVVVNGDPTVEPNETFFVNVTNVVGANVSDGQGTGTINNDDVVITNIHDIQGPGASSPIVGASVTTTGIVYAIRTNGYFIQNLGADNDADPATSEGIFVFTGGAPPAAVVIGAQIQVTGTVVEFVPASDPLQPPLTEIGSVTATTQLSVGNPLPAPTPLTAVFPSPAGAFDQLERLEGMRVSVAAFTVNSGSNGNVNETAATGSNNGVFHGFVAGAVARSQRESGIQPPDPPPAGTIPPIPRWDGNPELIRVDSDALPGTTALLVGFGQTVNNLVGPLDYGFRRYTIFPEPGSNPTVSGSIAASVVTAPTASEVTIASYNLQRFFNDVNDPGVSEPVLTATAFNNRLNKASLGIRNNLRTPDIVGVIEVENLATLQALATRINNDAVAASQPNPMYVAYLTEGFDVGGIDVGFLVKTAPAFGATPRVAVTEVVQELAGSLFTNPDTSTETLNDRPPLRLTGVVTRSTGQSYPLTVIVNHLRSFIGSTDTAPGSNGWATVSQRVLAKRHAQAVDLANFVQTRQTTNPNEQIVLVGDFNAFEFNDGLGDSMGTIAGIPSPDNTTAVLNDGADLVNPDFDNLFDTVPAAGRYSYNFDGVAQTIDHALVSATVLAGTVAPRVEHAYINADFPEIERSNAASPNRLSDHDPLVVYLTPSGFVPIDLSVVKTTSNPAPVAGGANFTYTVTVANGGPQPAANVVMTDVLPAGVRFVSLATPAGWTCTTPAANTNGTVSCNIASQPVGTASFPIVVNLDPAVPNGTTISNTASATTASVDSNPANNSGSVAVNGTINADLSVTLTDTPDPVVAGTQLTYVATLTNNGPSDAPNASITLPLPAGTSFVSAVADNAGTCNAASPVVCSWAGPIVSGATRSTTIVVAVAPAQSAALSATATASLTPAGGDPNTANDTATATTAVAVQADLSITLTDAPDPVTAGNQLTYTAIVTNAGPSDATAVVVNLPTPAGTSFVTGTVTGGGSCAAGISCTIGGSMAPGSSRTLTITVLVAPSVLDGTVINAAATVTAGSPDPNGGNNSASTTTNVIAVADLVINLTASVPQVLINVPLTFTATSQNLGPSDAQNVSITLTLTPDFRYSSHVATGATCTTPQIGTTGAIVCTWAGATAPGVTRTLSVVAYSNNEGNTAVSASTTSATTDPVANNNAGSLAVVVGFPFNEIPTLSQYGLVLLGLLMGLIGFATVRRQS